VESFIGRFRDECLNEEVFAGLAEARAVIGRWRRDYNHVRPHSALDGTPLRQRISGPRASGCTTPTSSSLARADLAQQRVELGEQLLDHR